MHLFSMNYLYYAFKCICFPWITSTMPFNTSVFQVNWSFFCSTIWSVWISFLIKGYTQLFMIPKALLWHCSYLNYLYYAFKCVCFPWITSTMPLNASVFQGNWSFFCSTIWSVCTSFLFKGNAQTFHDPKSPIVKVLLLELPLLCL